MQQYPCKLATSIYVSILSDHMYEASFKILYTLS